MPADMSEMENSPKKRSSVTFYFWVHNICRPYVELLMDIIILCLLATVFVLIGKIIYFLVLTLFESTGIAYVISEIMFIFILIEVIRLLVIYLEYHRIAIDTMVEISLVAVLREIILKGVLQIEPLMIVAASMFIIVLGLLLRLGGLRYTGPDTSSTYEPFFNYKTGTTGRKS